MVEINNIRYISSKELMDELRVSRQTLWRWRQEGKIPIGHRYRDGKILFTEEEAIAIRQYANRVDPIDQSEAAQLRLFNGIRVG
jgi:predicted DNA-binding transcriptional regulator AlpA